MAAGGAGYAGLRKIDNEISRGLQFWGGIAAQQAAEGRARNERQAVRKKKEIKEWGEKYDLKPEDFQNKYTGFSSYDDMNRDYARFNTDKYVELNRLAREAANNGDLREKTRLEGEMVKRKNNFKLASQGQERFASIFDGFVEATEKGEVSGSSKYFEDIMQAVVENKNVAIREDENGSPVYTGMITKEDGTKETFEIAQGDLMDGSFSWNQKQNILGKEGLRDNILNGLGSITKETEEGLFSITTQEWDDKIHGKATEKSIDTLMSSDSVMADLLYQFSNGESIKMRGFTDKDRALVKSKFKDVVRAGYNEKFGRDFDSGRAANQRGWAALNRKGKDTEGDMIEAEPMTSADDELLGGLPYPSTDTKLGVQDGGRYTLKTKGGKPIKGILAGDSESEVLSITKSGDQYLVDTRRTDMVTTKDRRTGESMKVPRTASNQLVLSDEELNRLARRMGLKTAGEMDSYLEQRSRDYKQSQTQSAESTKAKAAELIAKYKKK